MSLRDDLKSIEEQIAALETQKHAIYQASKAAPADEKVCEDWMAEMFTEDRPASPVEPRLVQAITVSGVVVKAPLFGRKNAGAWVAVRPCDKELSGKTFLGVYLGDIALGLSTSFHAASGVLEISRSMHNPAIWVPDLKRIVFGCESWWGVIKSPDDLRKITDADINGVWYVQALKALSEKPTEAS